MASKTTLAPINIVVFGLGALAIYSAIKDINPVELVKKTLQGEETPESGSWSPTSAQSVVFTGPSTIGTGLGLGLDLGTPGNFNGKMIWPTSARRISQGYGVKNDRYVSGYHTGIDIDGGCGDPIWSSTPGVVASAGYNGPYGLQVKVNVDPKTQIWYNHFQGIGAKIRPGQQVAAGTHLGKMGTTGESTGCHLHFEVRVSGKDVDPMPYLRGGSGAVSV